VKRTAGLFLLLVLSATAMADKKPVQSIYDPTRELSDQEITVEDGCLVFVGEMTAGDFFKGLESKKKRKRVEFKKNGVSIREYPDELNVLIRIAGADCYKGKPGVPPALVKDDSGTQFSFVLKWLNGEQVSPAEHSVPIVKRVRPTSYTLSEKHLVEILEYRFVVSSKNVPLTSRLQVAVTAEGGKVKAQISGGP
jgi:hypothetical protein